MSTVFYWTGLLWWWSMGVAAAGFGLAYVSHRLESHRRYQRKGIVAELDREDQLHRALAEEFDDPTADCRTMAEKDRRREALKLADDELAEAMERLEA